jgi:hypothetical protein
LFSVVVLIAIDKAGVCPDGVVLGANEEGDMTEQTLQPQPTKSRSRHHREALSASSSRPEGEKSKLHRSSFPAAVTGLRA